MDLPRPETVRRELASMGLVYGIVVAILLMGAVVLRLGSATVVGWATPTFTMPGPF
jgi:hypothetical protein